MEDNSPGLFGRFYCSNPFYTVKFSQLMTSGYMKSSISTIERRFGLSSQTSGMVASFHEVGNTMLIIFVSYFGSRVHRPRVIGCGAILVSVAGLGPATDVCTGSQRESNVILILLLFGQTLLGIGGVPIQPFGISYIDDFQPNQLPSLYRNAERGKNSPDNVKASLIHASWVWVSWRLIKR
ncbi:hypothetical protein E2320_005657 [Naja naja]|nr:hypothetical protein E2320_005657 [Naja naja]